jgi:hypothetical protein
MLEEEAKAVQEVAKTTGKALDIIKGSCRYLVDIFGESFKHLGGTVADWARYYRYRNFLLIADKVAEIHRTRHLTGKPVPIPPQYALPLIEGASLEYEDSIQDLWAGLIANVTDPDRKFNLKKVYIEILRSLEPLDAKILQLLSGPEIDEMYKKGKGIYLNTNEVARLLGENIEDVKISLHSLYRYNCIYDIKGEYIPTTAFFGFKIDMKDSNFRLSHIGKELVQATKVK